VVKEGELLKYRCANNCKNGSFVSRWVQVTEHKFRYYKTQVSAYQQPGKPLVSIPIGDILSIKK